MIDTRDTDMTMSGKQLEKTSIQTTEEMVRNIKLDLRKTD
jgi:hypothetical protein